MKKIFFSVAIALVSIGIVPLLSHADYVINDGSVKGLYRFDSDHAIDSSQNTTSSQNNLISVFGDTQSYVSGMFGNAVSYNPGASAYATSTSLGVQASGSISIWIKNGAMSGTPGNYLGFVQETNDVKKQCLTILNKNNGGTEQVIFDRNLSGVSETLLPVNFNLNDGSFHNVILSWDATSKLLTGYVDGTQVAQTTDNNTQGVSSFPQSEQVGMGYCSSGGVGTAQAIEDDFAVLNKALTATDATQIWNSGIGNRIVVVASVDTLSIAYPADMSSVSDFSQWKVDFANIASTSPAALSLGIRWGTTSTPVSMEHVDYLPYSLLTASTTLYVPKNTALQSNTTYWAQAFNLDSPYEVSPVISFNTGNVIYTQNTNPPSVSPFPSSTNGIAESTTSPFFMDCSQYSGAFFSSSTIGGLGCQAEKVGLAIIGFLVVPPSWASQALSGSFQNVLNAFPFSIPNTIVSNIQNAATSTNSAGENLTLSYLNFDQNGTTSYTLLTPTTLQDDFQVGICNATCAANTKDTIFNILTAIIWTLTAFAILKIL